jgi:hypothetical protein
LASNTAAAGSGIAAYAYLGYPPESQGNAPLVFNFEDCIFDDVIGNGVTEFYNDHGAAGVFSSGYNVCGDVSLPGATSGDQVNVNPLLGPLQNNGGPTPTMALLPGSPAIAAGVALSAGISGGVAVSGVTTDQRGVTRGNPPSIGAYEYVPPPLTPPQTFDRAPNISMMIPVSTVLAGCYNPSGYTLTLDSIGSSAQGADLFINSGLIFYALSANNNDTFAYTVSDGHGTTGTGVINIDVVNVGGLAQSINTSGGAVTINFAGIPGVAYDIQREASLSGPWATLTTEIAPADGLFSYTDPNPPATMAFYRLIQHINPAP